MKHKKGFAAVLLTLIISALLSVSAFAASDGFSDVPEASPFYESVTYLAGQGITYGTGNGWYAPDTPITVRQWATMLCRVFDKEDALSDPAGYGGDACINQGYADGWLNLLAMAAPDSSLCRYAIYESGFAAFDIALYSSQLYPEGGSPVFAGQCFPRCCELWLMRRHLCGNRHHHTGRGCGSSLCSFDRGIYRCAAAHSGDDPSEQ